PAGHWAGSLFYSGTRWQTDCCNPWNAPPSTALFDPGSGQWEDVGTLTPRNRTEGTSVMLPYTAGEAPKVLVLGGGDVSPDGESIRPEARGRRRTRRITRSIRRRTCSRRAGRRLRRYLTAWDMDRLS